MKYLIILIIAMLPLSLSAQKKGYAELSLMAGTGKELKQKGIAGTFAVGFKPSTGTSLGAGFNIIKFDGFKRICPTAYGDFRGYFKAKSEPFISMQVGKILYNQGTQRNSTTGGLYISGGIGAVLPTKSKVRPFGLIRYSGYNFNYDKASKHYGFISANIGLRF